MQLYTPDLDVIGPCPRPWLWISADAFNQLYVWNDISHRWLLLVRIRGHHWFMGKSCSSGAFRHTCVSISMFTQAIGLQIQRQILVSLRRKSAWGKGKEGEGETDRRWLSWAVIFWEPVLRLPGAIFKRPTSPHTPGGCRGERRGLCMQTQARDT